MSLKRAHSVNGTTESRRKEKHVSRACNMCRRRKSKCDGVNPVCGTCRANNLECHWATEEDGRRPATRQQVDSYKAQVETLKTNKASLEARIVQLEAELQRHGVNPTAIASSLGQLSITIPVGPGASPHARSMSLGGAGVFLPSSPVSPGHSFSYPHSPASATSSLPSPNPATGSSSHFLTVPGQSSGHSRKNSWETASSTDDDPDYAVSDSESDASAFMSPDKRLMVNDTDNAIVALSPSSPLALSTSPPHSPSRSRGSSFSLSRRSPSPMPAQLTTFRFPPTTASPPLIPSPESAPAAYHPLSLPPFAGPPCPCDWARHLPPEARMAGQDAHDALLHTFVLHSAPWQLRVVPRFFLRDMRAALTSPPGQSQRSAHYSPALHNALLADAGALAPGTHFGHPDVRAKCAMAARDLVDGEIAAPGIGASVSTITALSLLAHYHLGLRGGSALAFTYFGMAVRVAQMAGLNMDCTELLDQGRVTPENKWDRDWCYWSLLVQDVDMSLHVGQELSLPPPPANASVPALLPLPAPADEECWAFPTEPSGKGAEGSGLPSYVGRCFNETVALFQVAAEIMKKTGQGSIRDEAWTAEVHAQLADMSAKLPEHLVVRAREPTGLPHVLMLHITHAWVLILLHRTFLQDDAGSGGEPAGGSKTHAQFIYENAARILKHLETYSRLYGLSRAPLTAVQAAFAAASVLVVRANLERPNALKRRTEALSAARRGAQFLSAMGEAWGCAQGYADGLDAKINEVEHATGLGPRRQETMETIVTQTERTIERPGLHAHSSSIPLIVHTETSPCPSPNHLEHHRAEQQASYFTGYSSSPGGGPAAAFRELSPSVGEDAQMDALFAPQSTMSELGLFNSFGGPAQNFGFAPDAFSGNNAFAFGGGAGDMFGGGAGGLGLGIGRAPFQSMQYESVQAWQQDVPMGSDAGLHSPAPQPAQDANAFWPPNTWQQQQQ